MNIPFFGDMTPCQFVTCFGYFEANTLPRNVEELIRHEMITYPSGRQSPASQPHKAQSSRRSVFTVTNSCRQAIVTNKCCAM